MDISSSVMKALVDIEDPLEDESSNQKKTPRTISNNRGSTKSSFSIFDARKTTPSVNNNSIL